ncbi:MAG: ATP-dependent Clp protease proteolytic subunit [Candidatus Poribacteria bacterium]|nr:ATP-dependent Clp protease proteolytic subunit [Candidatus Poribacteria bacterium]
MSVDTFDRLDPTFRHIQIELNKHLTKIEEIFEADAIVIYSAIDYDMITRFKSSVDLLENRKKRLVIILNTLGGLVEVVENIVGVTRHFYEEVYFLIPDCAMSAGTILAMSGDKIFMSYSSCLGPIDPQVVKEGKLISALAYINQYESLLEKAETGQVSSVEFALINKLDLGELHEFQQARELSIELLSKWLTSYHFKNWKVNQEQKEQKSKEIANSLSDNKLWHSHSRMITINVLNELGLKIEEIEKIEGLFKPLNNYTILLGDFISKINNTSFISSREFF